MRARADSRPRTSDLRRAVCPPAPLRRTARARAGRFCLRATPTRLASEPGLPTRATESALSRESGRSRDAGRGTARASAAPRRSPPGAHGRRRTPRGPRPALPDRPAVPGRGAASAGRAYGPACSSRTVAARRPTRRGTLAVAGRGGRTDAEGSRSRLVIWHPEFQFSRHETERPRSGPRAGLAPRRCAPGAARCISRRGDGAARSASRSDPLFRWDCRATDVRHRMGARSARQA